MSKLYVADTNILLEQIENVANDYKIVLLSHTLRELDKHKSNRDKEELSFQARKAVRYIKNNRDKFVFDAKDYNGFDLGQDYDDAYQDNNILAACVKNQYGLISNDVLLTFKAKGFDLEVIDLEDNTKVDDNSRYTGIRDFYVDEDVESQSVLAKIYMNPNDNHFDMVENEYLVVWDKTKPTYNSIGEVNGYEALDSFRFDGEKLVKLKYKQTEDLFMGKTKPLNVKQQAAFDLLQNKNVGVKLLLGNQGTGKDYVIVAHLMQALQRDEIDKIVFIRNIMPLKDSGQTGFLPGTLYEKMVNWASPFIDALGGEDGFRMLFEKGKIEIQHFESIRGRSYTNCAVYCSEIQNMTGDHARMILSRIAKNSTLYLNGDIKQVDKDSFKSNSAINTLKKLKGHHLFGVVTFDKTERSEIAALSELI